ELLRQPGRKLVEVGPGQVLSTFVRQQAAAPAVSPAKATSGAPVPSHGVQAPAIQEASSASAPAGSSANAAAPASSGALAVPSLGERGGSEEHATLMRAVGRLWLAGIEIDGEHFFRDERRRRVPLPTYPFERQRYWIEASPRADLEGHAAASDSHTPEGAAGLAAGAAERPREAVQGSAGASEMAAADNLQGAAGTVAPTGAGVVATAKTLDTLAVAAPAVPEALAGTLSLHPRPALGNAYVAPRDEMERTVAGMWQRLLGVDQVGINDDFFELGGHSFLATRLVGELRDSLGLEVGMATLFDKPTIAGFAAAVTVEQMRQQESATPAATLQQIVPDTAGRHERFALTDVQQAYLIGRGGDFALGHVSTHVYAEIDARGLDVERLTQAFRFVVERHDMLRAVVYPDATQQVLQTVPPFTIGTLDLRGIPDAAADAALAAVRRAMSHQLLPSDRWPLYELRASLLDGGRVRLHFSFDFLIGDASSTPILLRDLGLAYRGRQSECRPLAVSFRDYVLAAAAIEELPAFRRALAYWTSRVADFPPTPDLPLAANPEAIHRPTFVRHAGHLDSAPWQRLKERAARHGLTSSGVLLAAFGEVLTQWAKSPRFTINLT
ncbi:MAG TPA: condensation domain-containing protein, partial [Thermoanaerobaculia bacterium]|nr:condensation domain-containing protein [Thermoanaerobaculia bacterium]